VSWLEVFAGKEIPLLFCSMVSNSSSIKVCYGEPAILLARTLDAGSICTFAAYEH
jgi:hypothetical protein